MHQVQHLHRTVCYLLAGQVCRIPMGCQTLQKQVYRMAPEPISGSRWFRVVQVPYTAVAVRLGAAAAGAAARFAEGEEDLRMTSHGVTGSHT